MNLNTWQKSTEEQSFLDSLIKSSRRGDADRPLPSRIFIPTSTMTSERDNKGISVRLHISGVKVPGHLLWHLLFKGITVIDWFLLYEFLIRNQNASPVYCACFSGILAESSRTRMSLTSFQHQMKPIHKNLKGYIPKMGFEILGNNLLELVMNLLEIPQKGLPKDRLYTDVNHSFRDPKPLQPASMGVGYKDKGSMGDGFPASLDEVIYESLGFDPSDFLATWLRIQSYFQKQV